MRKTFLSLLTTATVFLTGAGYAQAEIAWESSLRKAHDKASSEGKLLLLHFTRDNCVYCDKLEEGAFKTDTVSQAVAANFVPMKVNVSDSAGNKKLGEMFKVDRFPMDVVVTTDGKALVHTISPQDPNQYVAMLAKTLPTQAPVQQSAPQTQIAKAPAPQYTAPQQTSPQTAPAGPTGGDTWALPNPTAGAGVAASTVSSRSNGMSLSMPSQAPASASIAPPVAAATKAPSQKVSRSSKSPELAMDGYCPVTVVNESRWVEGKPDFGVIHLGKLYLFDSKQAMATFLIDPIPYTPVLNEIDVVRFFEERKIVKGKREFAMQDPVNKRMFFFADEDAMIHFENEWGRYVGAAIQVMDKAVKESNPGS
ncbi:Thiol:disulfide interchange protein DsbD [Rubripirellula amarantea]|uniref:Thiol:disulfide interchange protein DsbD n=1 Tax=Rubripirellula amarantea TaxID=2527999 RepID=A0A5C5WHL2_9BACT|nr:thioredoxin family protein [Rubripirellula amarantea]TWT50294.1 Thiol:disulfide interchange protein DsbD [Rubripirellula amarantea]